MKESTIRDFQNKINENILKMEERGLKLSDMEKLMYRQGIAFGISMSVLLFSDFDHNDLMKCCGL